MRIGYDVEVPTPPPRRHVISYRVDDLEWIRLQGLKATFDEATWPEMFDWLFSRPEVQRLIVGRLKAQGELPFERNEITVRKEHIPSLAKDPDPEDLLRMIKGDSVMADIGYKD